ncbi:glycosyltransferase [Candidatus Woesebacteria bacterium]|nr:glycosyltransferase [Candidatus Woesebacteria bacterium]
MSSLKSQNLKVALVHDQIAEFGGAERVLITLKKIYPQADVYTSFVDKKRLGNHWGHFEGWSIIESKAAKIPFFNKLYSPLRFLLPWVWSSFDLSDYDVVIASSNWGMSKGVSLRNSKSEILNSKSKSSPVYFCYLHAPPRYLYGYDESGLKRYLLVRIYALIVNHFLRQYDYRSSQAIDHFIFNSEEIRRRSLKFYRKDGVVVHPPITQVQRSEYKAISGKQSEYYLTVSRLAPTKHIDILIEAANKEKFALKVVGSGNQEKYLKSIAGPTVEFLGSVDDQQLQELYTNAKAFLYASVNEDFGMVPVEAMAQGTPVIAYASGGVLETVIDGKTGYLYHELNSDAVIEAVGKLEAIPRKTYHTLQEQARVFAQSCGETHFINRISSLISEKLASV